MKKTIGKLASLMLALIMVIGVLANPAFAVNEKTFDDVAEGEWYYGYVMMLAEDDIVGGFGGTNEFRPDSKLTREQAAKMIALAAKFEHEDLQSEFEDVDPNGWATGYIAALEIREVVKGWGTTGEFRPMNNIQRGHAAKMVGKAFGLKEGSLERTLTDLPADAEVEEAIKVLASNGIVKGYGGTEEFRPAEEISRAEFSKILCIAMVASAIQEAEAEGDTSEQIAKAQALLERLSVAGKDDDIDALNYLQGRVEDIEEAADAVKDVNEAKNEFRLGLALDNPLFKDVDADNMEEYFVAMKDVVFKTVAEINAAIAKVNSEIANAAKYDGVDGIKARLEKAYPNQVKVFEILEEEFEDADVDYIEDYKLGIFVGGNAPDKFEKVQEAIDRVNANKAAEEFENKYATAGWSEVSTYEYMTPEELAEEKTKAQDLLDEYDVLSPEVQKLVVETKGNLDFRMNAIVAAENENAANEFDTKYATAGWSEVSTYNNMTPGKLAEEKAKVQDLLDEYGVLSPEVQVLVVTTKGNLDFRMNAIEAAEDNAAAAALVEAMFMALPVENVVYADKQQIEDAINAYNALEVDQKSLISQDAWDKKVAAEAALAAIEAMDFEIVYVQETEYNYSVIVKFTESKASDIEAIEMTLFMGSTKLGTINSDRAMEKYPDADVLSAPFVFDSDSDYDYEESGSWAYSGWLTGSVEDFPTKVKVKVTFKSGKPAETKESTNIILAESK